jgi:hypothetical protein
MPYVHWELEEKSDDMKRVIDNMESIVLGIEENAPPDFTNPTMPDEEKLIRAYLNLDHPLHLRRTLDQYYYYTHNNTTTRDIDETIFRRFETEFMGGKKKRVVMMVDQLWMWVLGGNNMLSNHRY